MKKFIGSVALAGVLVLSLSSFTSVEQEMQTVKKKSCDAYASQAVRAEFMAYGFDTQAQVDAAYNWYYSSCVSANGNIQDPVFIP